MSSSTTQRAKAKRSRIWPQSVQIEPDCYYTDEQLAARYGTHKMTPWQWARRGSEPPKPPFPKPRKIGPNISRWYGAELIAYEQELARQEAADD